MSTYFVRPKSRFFNINEGWILLSALKNERNYFKIENVNEFTCDHAAIVKHLE